MESEIVFCDANRMIKITRDIIKLVNNFLQLKSNQTESGGILIGRENKSNGNLIIEFATIPMPDDIQKRNRYIRKDQGHIASYLRLYTDNNCIYRYVGEWHTHPECIPKYSEIDLKNWRKIAQDDPYNQMHFHLIAGTKAIQIWKMHYPETLYPEPIYSTQCPDNRPHVCS